MTNDTKKLLLLARVCCISLTIGFSVISQADNIAGQTDSDKAEQYFEDVTAHLPAGAAATKAVAQTLVQFELYKAYRLAEQQYCQNGWVLLGTLVDITGPDRQQWVHNNTDQAIWSFKTRRKLTDWTCNVNPAVYLESVRTHLPGWISIRYLSATDIHMTQTVARLK